MPRYDQVYRNLAERAVQQGGVDLRALFRQAETSGMAADVFQSNLMRDLDEGGPIFGKFFRSLGSAARSSTGAAMRQGQVAAEVEAEAIRRNLTELARTAGSVIDSADPQALGELEDEADQIAATWIAELVNTCHRCLPLHGTTLTYGQWREMGLHPDTIHADWASECHCVLEPSSRAEGRKELVAPMKRNKIPFEATPGQRKRFRRTERAVTQVDLDKSIKARDEAMRSPEGRRTLSMLGRSNSGK